MPTFTLISSYTVGAGGTSSIDFTSIPNTFTDLCLKVSARVDTPGNDWLYVKLNNTDGSHRSLYGNGASAGSYSDTSLIRVAYLAGTSWTANTFSNVDIYIPNYTSSNNKSMSIDFVSENNGTTAYQTMTAGLVSISAAVTSVTLYLPAAVKFPQYSTAYLYGVSNA